MLNYRNDSLTCGFETGAQDGTRTRNPLREAVFKTAAYAIPPLGRGTPT